MTADYAMRLADKAIVVTGSTTGIGRAIAARCGEEGARVVVHGRDRKRGEEVVRSLGDHVPSGRMTRPEEVAGAAVYWLSDESRPFNGIVIDLTQFPFLGRIVTREF